MSKKFQLKLRWTAVFLALFMVLGLFTACDTLVGEQGPAGPQGPAGADGKSAYELACENGYISPLFCACSVKNVYMAPNTPQHLRSASSER